MAIVTKPQSTHQADCDMSDPEQHFLWALSMIPVGGEMMPIQHATARNMSKHLHDLGFRHHPKLQKSKLQTPVRGMQTHLNGLNRWVPMDAEDPEPLALPDVKAMTSEEREWVLQELKAVGHITEPDKDLGPLAKATTLQEVLAPRVDRVSSSDNLK
jgi:hypothetical protein